MPALAPSARDAKPPQAARVPEGSPLAQPGAVLLISCYELGRQPFAVASPWAQLERAGFGVAGVDASLDPVTQDAIARARLVAISVPMHTALRLGVEIAERVRTVNPRAHICLFGLYASMNAPHLLGRAADSVIGGEFESALVDLAVALAEKAHAEPPESARAPLHVPGVATDPGTPAPPILRRLAFEVPRRHDLPALDRYAHLLGPTPGETRTVGYVEASRGCLHRCLHCPITPVYEGRFFIVPREVVLADAAQQIAAGARHITFGDPDFLNGVGHSMAIARELSAAHPGVTFDVTVKVEHILKHRERFTELAQLGCIFVVSAVESLSDAVLDELDKGHTRADIIDALRVVSSAGIALRPTFVAFTPWTTARDYVELCDFIVNEGLIDHVDPIQLAIRLLIPPGSALLRRDRPRPWLGELLPGEFGHSWTHPDPAMDRLHLEVSRTVEEAASAGEDAGATFTRIRDLAYRAAGLPAPPGHSTAPEGTRRFVPKLSEPWFCCAEPSTEQLKHVTSCSMPGAKEPADVAAPKAKGKGCCG